MIKVNGGAVGRAFAAFATKDVKDESIFIPGYGMHYYQTASRWPAYRIYAGRKLVYPAQSDLNLPFRITLQWTQHSRSLSLYDLEPGHSVSHQNYSSTVTIATALPCFVKRVTPRSIISEDWSNPGITGADADVLNYTLPLARSLAMGGDGACVFRNIESAWTIVFPRLLRAPWGSSQGPGHTSNLDMGSLNSTVWGPDSVKLPVELDTTLVFVSGHQIRDPDGTYPGTFCRYTSSANENAVYVYSPATFSALQRDNYVRRTVGGSAGSSQCTLAAFGGDDRAYDMAVAAGVGSVYQLIVPTNHYSYTLSASSGLTITGCTVYDNHCLFPMEMLPLAEEESCLAPAIEIPKPQLVLRKWHPNYGLYFHRFCNGRIVTQESVNVGSSSWSSYKKTSRAIFMTSQQR